MRLLMTTSVIELNIKIVHLQAIAMVVVASPGVAESRTLLDVIMISITGYTKVPNEAWEVVKALDLDHPVWRNPNPTMGGIPTLKAAYAEGAGKLAELFRENFKTYADGASEEILAAGPRG